MIHTPLTKIDGRPTFASMATLLGEVYANAMSVASNNGGGEHGHLGAITTAAEYQTLSNQNVAFVHPTLPPPQQPPAPNASNALLTEQNRQVFE